MILLNFSIWSSPPNLYVIIDFHSSTLFKPKGKKKALFMHLMLFVFIHIFTAFFVLHSFGHLPCEIGFLLSGIHLLNFLKRISFVTNVHTFLLLTVCFLLFFSFFKFIFAHCIILDWHIFSFITLKHSTVFSIVRLIIFEFATTSCFHLYF